MAQMTHAASVFLPQSEFDPFLFACIGQDGNNMQLSVLTALARADVDPWQEAAELARLPRATATKRLASLIAVLPDALSAQPDPGTVAARLVALLPSRAAIPAGKTLHSIPITVSSPMLIWGVFLVFVLVGAVFIAHYG